ncbi:MAG: cytochrome-c peroxidase [Rhizobium sp.]|nr:cytochrome-c peroxidase [Rhizobium sp.]
MKHSLLCLALLAALSATTGAEAIRSEPVTPLAAPEVIDAGKAELGKKLFFDPRLSRSGFISCNSCHNLSMGGSDNLRTSIGHNWQQGPINSPTVLNSSLSVAQFWDGRAANLQEQAGGPIANPGEMASTHVLAVDVVHSIPGYVDEFQSVFGSGEVSIERMTAAIAEFEKTLVTPGSRFDQWLLGDDGALSEQELAGYTLFKQSGCVACHNGAALGGNSFQRMGVVEPYQTDNPAVGRAGVTGKDADRFTFKVPTLRNIELTYPYFHDGAAETLEEAVQLMGRLQLGRTYSEKETADIVAFLHSLTGKQPDFKLPILPPSSNQTPAPEPFAKKS